MEEFEPTYGWGRGVNLLAVPTSIGLFQTCRMFSYLLGYSRSYARFHDNFVVLILYALRQNSGYKCSFFSLRTHTKVKLIKRYHNIHKKKLTEVSLPHGGGHVARMMDLETLEAVVGAEFGIVNYLSC